MLVLKEKRLKWITITFQDILGKYCVDRVMPHIYKSQRNHTRTTRAVIDILDIVKKEDITLSEKVLKEKE
tara:strand:+ start:607 stop:816 length:210 start_codon:yes stop_codon:yes gene_type:complete